MHLDRKINGVRHIGATEAFDIVALTRAASICAQRKYAGHLAFKSFQWWSNKATASHSPKDQTKTDAKAASYHCI